MEKFSSLRHGTVFTFGRYSRRFIRIEDVEDYSKQRWNAVALSGGVLSSIPKNANVLVETERKTAMRKTTKKKYSKPNESHLSYYVIVADDKGTRKVISEFRSTEEAAKSSLVFFKGKDVCSLFRLVE